MFQDEKELSANKKHIKKLEIFETFISDHKRAELLNNIKLNSYVSAEDFDKLFLQLIINIYNYVQLLPDSSNNYFTNDGGFFDYALHRTEAALSLLKKILLLENNTPSPIQKLWNYILFSAGF